MLPFTPAPSGAAPRDWSDFPALLTLLANTGGGVSARTAPDSAGTSWSVRWDVAAKRFSALSPDGTSTAPAASSTPRLDQVLVFNGGLFDQFSGRDTLDLGDGFALVHRDSGYALLDHGTDKGWPAVTEDDVSKWGKEVRLGLPRDFPEDQLHTLFDQGRMRNVPGPFVRLGDTLWFGLAGGFTAGEGQLGGLVAYDVPSGTFRVVRHKFMVDVAVTRLLAVGNELWIGTGRYSSSRLEGLRGMLLYRPQRKEWRQFGLDNSRISGDLVYDALPLGRDIWVTTNQGISRYDLDRHLWSSWYWHAAHGGGYELTQERPVDMAGEFD